MSGLIAFILVLDAEAQATSYCNTVHVHRIRHWLIFLDTLLPKVQKVRQHGAATVMLSVDRTSEAHMSQSHKLKGTGEDDSWKKACMRTLFRLPKPSLLMASVFHSGKGGSKAMSPALRQPRGTVRMTAAPSNSSPTQGTHVVAMKDRTMAEMISAALRQPRGTVTMTAAPLKSSPTQIYKYEAGTL